MHVTVEVQRQGCSSERGATVMMGLVQMQCNKTKKRGCRVCRDRELVRDGRVNPCSSSREPLESGVGIVADKYIECMLGVRRPMP